MKIIQHNIFGETEDIRKTKTRDEVIADYEGFVDKFNGKVTTDDCYTPPKVYDAIKEWVNDNIITLDGHEIIRPFKPGGDYIHEEYPENCIVLDNPPFSILAQIRRFYHQVGVKYFLFAPSLTLANSAKELESTYIIANAGIVYENGAKVSTSFITNLDCDGIGLWVAGDLYKKVEEVQDIQKDTKQRYAYPMNVCSSAILGKIASRGITLKIKNESIARITVLDSQKADNKAVFGGGGCYLREPQLREPQLREPQQYRQLIGL